MSNDGNSLTTTDHKTIKSWAEKREAKPAKVTGTGDKNDPGLLRLNFPGYAEEGLEDISWEDFFEKFDNNKLVFLYQDKKNNGELSNFFKFVSKEAVEQ